MLCSMHMTRRTQSAMPCGYVALHSIERAQMKEWTKARSGAMGRLIRLT
jgi:hypothetical protein